MKQLQYVHVCLCARVDKMGDYYYMQNNFMYLIKKRKPKTKRKSRNKPNNATDYNNP